MKVEPTPEQLEAIRRFAEKYGVQWKAELRDQWMSGRDAYHPDGHLLRQVRNQCGPQWLAKFKL